MVNVYDSANQLASDIQEIDEYKALQEAIEAVENSAESTDLFRKMDQIQSKIMNAQAQGQELSEEMQTEYQKLNDDVQKDPQILKLLQAEQGLYKTVEDVQKVITKPINDLFNGLRSSN